MEELDTPALEGREETSVPALARRLSLHYRDRIIGIHPNFIPRSFRPFLPPDAALQDEEKTYLEKVGLWVNRNEGYSHLQRTRRSLWIERFTRGPCRLDHRKISRMVRLRR
jgi:hypothetical protein